MSAADDVLERKPAGARRSQAARRSEAERALLQAAVRLVAEHGLERFTLADVGEEAGYSRGLPAHYFGSKEGLVGALAQHIVDEFGRGVARLEKHPAGFARVLSMAALYFDGAEKGPAGTRALFAVLGEAVTNAKLRKTIAEMNARSVSGIAANLKAGIAAGEVREGINAKAQGALILAGLRGAVAQWLMDPEGIDLKALKSEFLADLKRSLAP